MDTQNLVGIMIIHFRMLRVIILSQFVLKVRNNKSHKSVDCCFWLKHIFEVLYKGLPKQTLNRCSALVNIQSFFIDVQIRTENHIIIFVSYNGYFDSKYPH